MKRFLFFIIAVFCFTDSFSQHLNNIWYFGQYAGLDFNNTPPTVLSNSAMDMSEGCATMCDASGQIMFYTNGIDVWNRNHQVMPNGSGLMGAQSSTQSALIVPLPGSNTLYYIFTTPQQTAFVPMTYSILDMTLNGGLGDITTKNVTVYMPVTEKLTATFKSNGVDYWIISKEANTNAFIVYSFTSAGLDMLNPVVSYTGISTIPIEIGYARVSPNGAKLAVANFFSQSTQLFDFNNNTGVVSNPLTLPVTVTGIGTGRAYGIEFSPDNSKLYIMQCYGYILNQYDLLAGSPTAIQNSAIEIAHTPPQSSNGAAMMLGPDNKIYISDWSLPFISVIDQPNLPGTACNFLFHNIQLSPGSLATNGLPNTIHPFTGLCPLPQNVNSSATICANQSYQLPSGTLVNSSGIYHDTIRNHLGTCDSIITIVDLSLFPISYANSSAQICSGQTYQLPSGTIVNASGIYQDTIRSVNSCDSVINTVDLLVLPVSYASNAAQICSGQTYQLPSGTIVNTTGIYQDTTRSVGLCDSIITTVNLEVLTASHVNSSTQLCSGQTYQLPSGTIVNAAGIYQDTIRSSGSCDSIITTIQLQVNEVSSFSIIDSIYEGEPYILPGGQTVYTAGVYQTVLQNSFGCDSVITTTLKLKEPLSECITLKNAFTPNGDGINDYWVLYRYNCFKRLEVNVYNRYGSLVYHSDDYKNDWSGKYKNKELPDGTYYYVIKVISFDGKEHVFKDNVTILR
ncbi:MAG: gliding motility-associated C-terminal domain-containing protein [Ferruginibacter sp.]